MKVWTEEKASLHFKKFGSKDVYSVSSIAVVPSFNKFIPQLLFGKQDVGWLRGLPQVIR